MLGKVKTLFGFSARQTSVRTVRQGEYDQELDTRGWNCPMPVLKVKKALDELEAGKLLHVITTDPGSLVNLRGLANQPGISLLESAETGDEFHFVLKKDDKA
jgi:tRNA 2-thiouridine synthesizing protein A